MYLSAAYQDLLLGVLLPCWAPVFYAGCNVATTVQNGKKNADNTLVKFEAELKEGKHYLFGKKPTVADFFLFEGLDAYASAFGATQLQQKFPTLVLTDRRSA